MGLTRDWICPGCGYSALTDAGPSRGFYAQTNTFVCVTCKNLVDLVVGRAHDKGGEIEPINTRSKCPKCHGSEFTLWDSWSKPCPRCFCEMEVAKGGTMILWD